MKDLGWLMSLPKISKPNKKQGEKISVNLSYYKWSLLWVVPWTKHLRVSQYIWHNGTCFVLNTVIRAWISFVSCPPILHSRNCKCTNEWILQMQYNWKVWQGLVCQFCQFCPQSPVLISMLTAGRSDTKYVCRINSVVSSAIWD